MSIIRMSPEFVASGFHDGEEFRVIEGGAPLGAEVVDVRIEDGGVEGHPKMIVVEVDDGLPGVRTLTFENLGRR